MTAEKDKQKKHIINWLGISIILSVIVVLTGGIFFQTQGIVNVLEKKDIKEIKIEKPFTYILLSPISEIFDVVSFLTLKQHIALLAWAIIIFTAIRFRKKEKVNWNDFKMDICFAVAYFLSLTLIALIPRPMARLKVEKTDLIIIDFHSHTNFSDDAFFLFSPEANRKWHKNAGFNVAFITDHNTISGAIAGMKKNPKVSEEEVILLPGEEISESMQNIVVLGNHEQINNITNETAEEETKLLLQKIRKNNHILSIVSLSGTGWKSIKYLPSYIEAGGNGFEIATADTRTNGYSEKRYEKMIKLAKEHNLFLTTSSDIHGWGYANFTWSVMSIPGWRALTPNLLEKNIMKKLREDGINAVIPIKRDTAPSSASWQTTMLIISIPLKIIRSLSFSERVIWVLWIWSFAFIFSKKRILEKNAESDM